jgi:hypothetical protein
VQIEVLLREALARRGVRLDPVDRPGAADPA